MPIAHVPAAILGLSLLGAATGHAILTCLATRVWRMRTRRPPAVPQPPVTLLKPLCGAEPALLEHLRTFCEQDYPQFQIIFGVSDPADPALAVVARLATEYAQLPIDVVVAPSPQCANLKVGNLVNMMALARHEILVLADSDTWVGPDYLAAVTAPLQQRDVGLVTCLYRDVPTAGVWSRLGAMYINEWYIPAVQLALLFGFRGYCSGQTLCIRRETLQRIGGFQSVADQLADDNRLGELVRAAGLRIELSRYPVHAQHDEADGDSLAAHELRWMQTLRILRPGSFRLLFFSFSLPLAAIGAALAALEPRSRNAAGGLLLMTAAARLFLHVGARLGDRRALLRDLWLLPVRDLLLCAVWCRTFFTSHIVWRGHAFAVGADGVMHETP
jgi:ceramide glucosyltransferase